MQSLCLESVATRLKCIGQMQRSDCRDSALCKRNHINTVLVHRTDATGVKYGFCQYGQVAKPRNFRLLPSLVCHRYKNRVGGNVALVRKSILCRVSLAIFDRRSQQSLNKTLDQLLLIFACSLVCPWAQLKTKRNLRLANFLYRKIVQNLDSV